MPDSVRLTTRIEVGSRVRVPLHGRRVGAWVVQVGSEPPLGVALSEIAKVSGHGPPPAVLELAEWASWRWAIPLATLLRTASPERNVWHLPVPARGSGPPRPRCQHNEGSVVLRREAPAEDLLPIVLEVIGGASAPVLVLAPSTGWANRLAGRLRRRGVDVAGGWEEAAAGWPVVVGSRAAAWAPMPMLGAAVVLDAHDYSDRYDSTEVVAERARREGAPCTLVSPCPTVVQRARYGPVLVPERSKERAGWAALVVADRRISDPRTGLFSEQLVGLARHVLPDRLVCVLNRTGRARLLACGSCGTLARCEECGRAVESDGERIRCARCGAERPVVCAACGSTRLKVLRQGVSRVREELAALLGTEVAEVTGSSPADPPDVPVLVGTEAVLHRVRRAGAVAFLDFDQHLLAPRYAAGEEALALLARAARIATTVLVQTRIPDHDVIQAALSGDPGRFTEIDVRRELRLPPFGALATVRAGSAPALAGVEVSAIGPGRWLVRADDHQTLCDAVAAVRGGVRIDPTDV